MIAKTNMPEAAFGAWGYSPVHGVTLNPWNTAFTTGGSSSGTAAALAAGFAPMGLGSDTGGSLRSPAECCGCVGFRPSKGRYSDKGIVPCDVRRDTAGPMARSVADLALMDAVITDNVQYAPAVLSDVSVAVPHDFASKVESVSGLKKALEIVQTAFADAGASVKSGEEVTLKTVFPSKEEWKHAKPVSFTELGFQQYVKEHEDAWKEAGLELDAVLDQSEKPAIKPYFKTPFFGEVNLSAVGEEERAALIAAHDAELRSWEEAYTKFFDEHGVDVVLTPCNTSVQPEAMSAAAYKDAQLKDLFGKHMGLTFLAPTIELDNLSACRVPCLALPTSARHEEGVDLKGAGPLPAGVLLWGRVDGDQKLLEVALALEVAMK